MQLHISTSGLAVPAVEALRKSLRDMRPAMANIGEIVLAQVMDAFEQERSPAGEPWAQSKRAQAQGGKTLANTGRLKSSFGYRATGKGVTVGSAVPYARWHQRGTRPYTIRPRNKRALFWLGAPHPVTVVHHPGLPARPLLPTQSSLDWPEIMDALRHHLLGGA